MWSVPSEIDWGLALMAGTSDLRIWSVSAWLDSEMTSEGITSIGTGVVKLVRGLREPTTTMTSLKAGSGRSWRSMVAEAVCGTVIFSW